MTEDDAKWQGLCGEWFGLNVVPIARLSLRVKAYKLVCCCKVLLHDRKWLEYWFLMLGQKMQKQTECHTSIFKAGFCSSSGTGCCKVAKGFCLMIAKCKWQGGCIWQGWNECNAR